MRTPQIIVGVDGTASGWAAVVWAAREAAHRRALLRVVHVFDWEWMSSLYGRSGLYLEKARRHAQAVSGEARELAGAIAPEVEIEVDALIGKPVDRLLHTAAEASLVVLGHGERDGAASLLQSSLSQRVATHVPCPVVVVRGRSDAADGPVVVGVDGFASAEQVLRTAFQAAFDRGAAVVAVRALLPSWSGTGLAAGRTSERDAAELARVERLLEPWRQKFTEVPVTVAISHGNPAAVLLGASHRAQLVVVGSRGRGAVAGALLGSTGVQLLHHADCPVWIVH
ncbi:universal stress protein [Actinoplanes sp. NPDC051633]|uniref:universal stress protein n=1 Tax=Actinoplanes sp. NPDC051633 TaxID=3155670 RepID=UPI0034259243